MVTADDREYTQHPEILTYLPGCQIQRLEAGDYAFNDYNTNPVGIERCELSNLMQKLNSGELEEQLRKAEDLYTKFYLLTEGVWDKDSDGAVQLYKHLSIKLRGHYHKAYLSVKRHGFFQFDRLEAFLIRIEEMGVRLLSSANFKMSMDIVRLIAIKQGEPPEGHKLFTSTGAIKIPVKYTKNPAVPRLMALCPRLPERTAILLIDKFGCILSILMQSDEELLKIDGMGKTFVARLRESVST